MANCTGEKEMWNMAAEELDQALVEERRLQHLLLKSLLPKDDADERDCILEVRAGKRTFYVSLYTLSLLFHDSQVRLISCCLAIYMAGTGGEEASLFAMDMFKMCVLCFTVCYLYILINYLMNAC